MSDVHQRIEKSRSRTVNLVWPIIGPILGGGELLQIEGFTQLHPALKFLDAMAGIDHLIFRNPVGIGLASRVQNGDDFDYSTITVRYELANGGMTEYARHLKQMSTAGAIKPLYWCQAYVSTRENRVRRLAVAYVRDVIAAVGDKSLGWLAPPTRYDGNRFWAIDWWRLRDTGVPIWIYQDGAITGPANKKPTQGQLF